MGQRSSVQQPGSDVAHRPRTSSDISNGLSSRHQRHRSNNNSHSRFQQNDSTSSSSPSNRTSTDEDNRSEEDGAADLNFASILMSHLGLNSSGISPPVGPSNSAQRANIRHSEGGTTLSSTFFHNRNPRNHQRFGGSQRSRRALVSSSTSSTNDLLSNSRLEALLRGLEDSLSASDSTSSSSIRVVGTQKQQSALSRLRHSLPLLQLIGRDLKCPVCHKIVPLKDVEVHLVMCFTRPVLSYNDDVLTADKGECSICLEDMSEGDNIARLPCLCIYHKNCIDEWFKRKNTCPEHPPVEDD